MKTKVHKCNITKEEHLTLQELTATLDIVMEPAVKENETVVYLDTVKYENKLTSLLTPDMYKMLVGRRLQSFDGLPSRLYGLSKIH